MVPEYAKVWYYVRDINRDRVESNYQRVLNAAEGAAIATGTKHEVHLTTGVHKTLLNRTLIEALDENLRMVGPPEFTTAEQEYAKELQKFLDKEQKGFSEEIGVIADSLQPPSGGSTDVAEVSFITPTVGFSVTSAPVGVPWHSWATTSSHNTSGGKKSAVIAAKVISSTAVELLLDDELLMQAREEFLEANKGDPYVSPIPEDQKPPVPDSTE